MLVKYYCWNATICLNLPQDNQECPYGDEKCIFVHGNSEECKFGKACERDKCMFKHIIEEHDEENDEEHKDDRDDNEKTVLNPSQSDESEANDENEKEDANKEVIKYKCDVCMFNITDSKRLMRHTFENHFVSHNWKKKCDTRKLFNSHRYHGCGSKQTRSRGSKI